MNLDAEQLDVLGKAVRDAWVRWAWEQPDLDDHPSWLTPWRSLGERDRDVDRRIAQAVIEAAGLLRTAGTDPHPEPCVNCDGRKCMSCVLREWHEDCVDDCPSCCGAYASVGRADPLHDAAQAAILHMGVAVTFAAANLPPRYGIELQSRWVALRAALPPTP